MNYCYRFLLIFGLSALLIADGNSQTPLKREFRGAWIATVSNLDWPNPVTSNSSIQQTQLTSMLDKLKANGITAVVFQIRSECDAMYQSSIEPWSYYLTGLYQGAVPSPPYDPLQFALEEVHERGMELHAWFNPYRAVVSAGSHSLAPTHVSIVHPEWILAFGSLRMLNPGIPAVRDYVTSVIMDVVRRYDVDGIHFDDYFYPYDGITYQDSAAYRLYGRGIPNIGDWRRDNVNLLVKMVHDSVQAVKPHVKFGISPFGIWKNSAAGTSGLESYYDIYCDPVAWLQAKTIDYVTPQIYWYIGYSIANYAALAPWWATVLNGRHLYIGQAAYRISSWSASEMPNQLRLNRSIANIRGSIFFRANNGINDNLKGFADSLKGDFYKYLALLPVMSWKDSIPPYYPRGIHYAPIAAGGRAAIQWQAPNPAPDGDSASRYVVYRFDHTPTGAELADPRNMLEIVGSPWSIPSIPAGMGPYYYVVTALDRNYNEGDSSNVLCIWAPPVPILASPTNGAGVPDSVMLTWRHSAVTSTYWVQLSTDSTFSSALIVNDSTVADTFRVVAGLTGQQAYYWRVLARNAGGTGLFSGSWSFSSGIPATAVPAYPANYATNVPTSLTFVWNQAAQATSYRFQLSAAADFSVMIVDTGNLADTTFAVAGLQYYRLYFWRVRSANAIGLGQWSPTYRFRTVQVSGVAEQKGVPTEYELSQNFPNPFNPTTTIQFAVPNEGHVTIKVYSILGNEIDTVLDEEMPPGRYSVMWNGANVASGVYFYRMVAGTYVATHRMMLVK